jgi:toxin-antitoxin system PIN domain toxin
VIAVDTNILLYAHRGEAVFHAAAKARLRELAEGSMPWGIPWSCVHEFLSIATHPRVFSPASTLREALSQMELWMESPTLILLAEGLAYWKVLADVLRKANVTGPLTHDARIAAVCLQHGVSTLWSADRDFSRFAGLKVVNPLVR